MLSIILYVVYHSTGEGQHCDHIRLNLNQPLFHQPNSLVIVVDVNSTSTGLHLSDLTGPNNLKKMVI